jgi:Putative prokaryotic signal transducing protein
MSARQPLVCPSCARRYPGSERFCERCAMPLVYAQDEDGDGLEPRRDPRRRHALKIKPEFARGPLVRVAVAEGLLEAEFIAGLLLEEGIPSVLRASIAGYTPMVDPREVMVPASAQEAAREALTYRAHGASG